MGETVSNSMFYLLFKVLEINQVLKGEVVHDTKILKKKDIQHTTPTSQFY
jgi:hypothetical protein